MKAPSLALLLVLAACGGGDEDRPRNNIKVTVLADAMALRQGVVTFARVAVERPDGVGDVTLRLVAPEAVYGNDLVLPAGATEGVLELVASSDADIGVTKLLLTATADGGDGAAEHPVEVLAAAPSTHELINQALESGAIDYPTSVLYRGYALIDDARLPEHLRGVGTGEDLGFPIDAADPTLPEATRTALAPFLLRPADVGSIFQTLAPTTPGALTANVVPCNATDPSQDVQGGFKTARAASPVRIWVQCTGDDAADDQVLADGVGYASSIYGPMTSLMGPPVLDDTTVGAPGNLDSAIDVYIVQDGGSSVRSSLTHLGNGVAYIAPPFVNGTSSGYILIGRSRAESAGFKSTLIHELFHILQDAHNQTFQFVRAANNRPSIEYWWVEASATWASSYYARSLAPVYVYGRFADFQRNPLSLHRSYAGGDHRMYAAFIWGFWAEHDLGGPQVIGGSWDSLTGITTHEAANTALDGVFDFTSKFRKFAIANINEDWPDALSTSKRHRGLDNSFPEPRPRVVYSADRVFDKAAEVTDGVEIPTLKAAYYRYTPRDDVKKIIVHFDGITTRDGLDIDGVIKKGDKWEVEDYTSETKKVFCIDRDEIRDIVLVLSSHDLPLTQFVLGNLRVEAFELPCESAWAGTLRHELIQNVPEAQTDITLIETADVRLVQTDEEDPTTIYDFVPTGTFRWNRSGTLGECTLFSDDYHGTFGEGPAWGGLHFDGSTSPPTYYGQIGTDSFNTVQHVTCPDPESNFDIEGPQSAGFWLVYFNEPFALKEENTLMEGERTYNVGGHLEKWKWNLRLEQD